jgi:hypothetical protein
MSKREVVNSTVYRTQDVVDIVDACLKVSKWSSNDAGTIPIKIRYMNNPAKHWKYTPSGTTETIERYADVIYSNWYNSKVEVKLVRPSKITVSALRLLAEAGNMGETMEAPTILKDHLVRSICGRVTYRDEKADTLLDACKGMVIRQDDKAKDRKAYTLANLQKKVEAKERAINRSKDEIASAERMVEYHKKRLKQLKKELPALKKKVKDFK